VKVLITQFTPHFKKNGYLRGLLALRKTKKPSQNANFRRLFVGHGADGKMLGENIFARAFGPCKFARA
jgi:hypothetical protein